MIALCYLEERARDRRQGAEARARAPGHGRRTISIRYNLGWRSNGSGTDKAFSFQEVYLLNVDFFKVATKVRELK
jgi:hypothetical protein